MGARIATRGLRRRKLRNGLTILAVVFAVGILVGVNIAGDSIMVQVMNTILAAQGDIDLNVRWATGEPFNIGNMSIVSSEEGIKAYSPRFGNPLYYLNRSLMAPVTLVGVIPSLDEKFGSSNVSLSLLSQTNSCIVTEEVAGTYNLTEGSTLVVSRVQTIPPFQPPSATLWKLNVVGIAHAEGKGYSGVLIANLSLAQDVFDKKDMINSIVASVVNLGDTSNIRARLQGRFGSNFQVLAPKESSLSQVNNIAQGFKIAMNMAATISLAVACILIMNSLLMAVNERKYEIGVLRSIGSSRGMIFRMFLLEGFFFGAIGSLLGIGFGILLSQLLVYYMTSLLSGGIAGQGPAAGLVPIETPSLVVNSNVLVFGVAAGIIVAVVGSLYPALSASRTNVVQAIRPQMRGAGRGRLGTGIMAALGAALLLIAYYVEFTSFRTTALGQMSFDISAIYILLTFIPAGILLLVSAVIRGVVGVLSYLFAPILRSRRTIATRNTSRNRRRSSLTISMVAIGISFTVLIGGMSGSLMFGINNFVRQQLGADIYIMPTGGTLPVSYADNLTSIDGVKAVTYLRVQPTKIEWKVSALAGVKAETFSKVWHVGTLNSTYSVDEAFEKLSESNTSMIMASGLAGKLNVSIGENVSVLVGGGKRENFTVIATFFGSEFINVGPISEDNMALIDYKALTEYFPSEFNASKTANVFLAKVVDGANPSVVAGRITNSTKQDIYIFTISDILKEVESGLSRIFTFFQVLIAMAIVVSLLGMTTTMVMSVLERKREIGILRAIGTSKSQVIGMIIAEALILGFIGLATGLTIGVMFSNYFIDIMTFVGFSVPLQIPYTILLYVALASIFISVVSAAYPARKAATMNVVDAIRYG
nr:FtsX-like permease family protein [Candidatus Njordarchaeum guaymaensis]